MAEVAFWEGSRHGEITTELVGRSVDSARVQLVRFGLFASGIAQHVPFPQIYGVNGTPKDPRTSSTTTHTQEVTGNRFRFHSGPDRWGQVTLQRRRVMMCRSTL